MAQSEISEGFAVTGSTNCIKFVAGLQNSMALNEEKVIWYQL